MAIDFANYEGREQAFVKHTFLDKYLPALVGKVCSKYDEFVYVDGFSGPWQSVAGMEFTDTSFGIALNHMTAQKLFYRNNGRNLKMRAFLVEKDAHTFTQLREAIARFPEIAVEPLNGMMEDHVAYIASSIAPSAFSFTLIDPKGFPDISAMIPLLRRNNAEALVNFMFDFANRFAGTDLIPALEAWLSTFEGTEWREQVEGLSGLDRERKLERLAAGALQISGDYAYSPLITVDKVHQDRPLYKLIFLSRSLEGLMVFRDSEKKALDAQAEVRSLSKAQKRAEISGVGDLFADGADAIPNDRSIQLIRRNQKLASLKLNEIMDSIGPLGLTWKELWPPILEEFSVTRSWLGRYVNGERKLGLILAPDWPNEKTQIPKDGQRLIRSLSIS